MADYAANSDTSLEADLYSANAADVDIENIASTGNLNMGLVIDYDAKADRRIGGSANSDDSLNHGSQQYASLPQTQIAENDNNYQPVPTAVLTPEARTGTAAPAPTSSSAAPATSLSPDSNSDSSAPAAAPEAQASSGPASNSTSTTNVTEYHSQTINNYYNTTNNEDHACGCGDINITNNYSVVMPTSNSPP